MSLSKSKYWYSNNCVHFLKCVVPLAGSDKYANLHCDRINYRLKKFYSTCPLTGSTTFTVKTKLQHVDADCYHAECHHDKYHYIAYIFLKSVVPLASSDKYANLHCDRINYRLKKFDSTCPL